MLKLNYGFSAGVGYIVALLLSVVALFYELVIVLLRVLLPNPLTLRFNDLLTISSFFY